MTTATSAPTVAAKETPQFKHGSDSHFLGRHVDPQTQEPMDLYVHTTGLTTVIARMGEDGNYMSSLAHSYGSIPALGEARRRAQAEGLLRYNLDTALTYAYATDMNDTQSVDEMKAAIAAAPDWQAYLAFEAGDTHTAQNLLSAMVEEVLVRDRARDPQATMAGAYMYVTERLDKMLRVMKGLDWLESRMAANKAMHTVVAQYGSYGGPSMLQMSS